MIDTLSGILADIAADVQRKAGTNSAGIQADFAIRMAAAYRSAPRHTLAGILQALQAEMSQALAAVAEAAASEVQGRQQAAIAADAGKQRHSHEAANEDEIPVRPDAAASGARHALAR